MNNKLYAKITSAIFVAVGLLHLARLVFGWEAVIGAWTVPMWLSAAAALIAGSLVYHGIRLGGR